MEAVYFSEKLVPYLQVRTALLDRPQPWTCCLTIRVFRIRCIKLFSGINVCVVGSVSNCVTCIVCVRIRAFLVMSLQCILTFLDTAATIFFLYIKADCERARHLHTARFTLPQRICNEHTIVAFHKEMKENVRNKINKMERWTSRCDILGHLLTLIMTFTWPEKHY
jgi:hypothetical protein